MSGDAELATLRAEIDAIDRALVDLLAARREVVERIAAHKRAHGQAGRDPAREAAMRAAMSRYGAQRGVPEALVTAVLEVVLTDSRAVVGA